MTRKELYAVANIELYPESQWRDLDLMLKSVLLLAAKKICFLCKNHGPSEPAPNGTRIHRYGKETTATDPCKASVLYLED